MQKYLLYHDSAVAHIWVICNFHLFPRLCLVHQPLLTYFHLVTNDVWHIDSVLWDVRIERLMTINRKSIFVFATQASLLGVLVPCPSKLSKNSSVLESTAFAWFHALDLRLINCDFDFLRLVMLCAHHNRT